MVKGKEVETERSVPKSPGNTNSGGSHLTAGLLVIRADLASLVKAEGFSDPREGGWTRSNWSTE